MDPAADQRLIELGKQLLDSTKGFRGTLLRQIDALDVAKQKYGNTRWRLHTGIEDTDMEYLKELDEATRPDEFYHSHVEPYVVRPTRPPPSAQKHLAYESTFYDDVRSNK